MVRRPALLALVALVIGPGCHAGLSGGGPRTVEPPVAREAVTVQRFVALHNRNASSVKSLTSMPRIVFSGDGRSGRVNGRMAMERPRGFRMEIEPSIGGKVADLGSNDQEFWFWVKDDKAKRIYVCDYKDVEASQLAVTYQPDWIVEALGLREIDPREAKTIAARPGDQPGTLVLTQARRDNRGEMLTKETIVDETTGHIKEHRLWGGAKKDLLAKATISQYKGYKMAPTDQDPDGPMIELPEKFRLEWVAEKFSLDVTMSSVRVNQTFQTAQRADLFSEPTISGVTRQDLAQAAASPTSSSKVYESMPRPRSGVRLGQPEAVPMGVEGGIRLREEPQPLSADLSNTPAQPSGVVGASATDPATVRASATRPNRRPSLFSR